MHIQEEIEMRTMTLIINSSKLTVNELRSALAKLLAQLKSMKNNARTDQSTIEQPSGEVIPHGKQTVKELIGQDVGVSNVEIKDKRIRSFERVARKYGVDYAVKRVRSKDEGTKYLIFFKSRDGDAITAALTEFTAKRLKHKNKSSVVQKLHEKQEQVQEAAKNQTRNREKHRELER